MTERGGFADLTTTMLCPAAVSAVAAALWLLGVLGPGLSVAANDDSDPGFKPCSHCFYRQTPPQAASAGLRPLCHRLPGGQTFATLSKPTCDTVVYSAFHLSHGSTDRAEEGGELLHDIKVSVPALLSGGRHAAHPVSPTDFPLQHWDSRVTTLVQSSITPQCSTIGGELYVLNGAGRFGAAKDGDEGCQMKPLWSALCCSVPQGKGGFSVGFIREAGKEEKQVSVKELVELLGVQELFYEGCGGTDDSVAFVVDLHSEGQTESRDASGEGTGGNKADLKTAVSGVKGESGDSKEGMSAGAEKSVGSRERAGDVRRSGAASSASLDVSADYDTVEETETDTDSSSILLYILSTTFSILTAPLRPVVSTLTQLPGQVTYVLQEDLGVLCALPGDIFSIFHLLTSDILSGIGSAAEMLLGIVETIFSSAYFCTSSMLEALTTSCHAGVTGMGTLAGDTVGMFGDAVDNVWWLTKLFGGRLWEQSEDYAETVMSEVGAQAKVVGKGFGTLVWRSGNGVGNVFRLGEGLITGLVHVVIGGVQEAFGKESE